MRRVQWSCIVALVALAGCDHRSGDLDVAVDAGQDDTGDGLIELPPATSQVRTPTGVIAGQDQWLSSTGGSKWADVHDPWGGEDDAASYVYERDAVARQMFSFAPFDLTNVAEIVGVTLTVRHARTAAGPVTIQPLLRIGETVGFGETAGPRGAVATESWTTTQFVWTTNPATSAAWTESDVETQLTGFGVGLAGIAAREEARVTQVTLEVHYVPTQSYLVSVNDPSCADEAGAGTASRPYCTVRHASTIAEPGDTFLVLAGRYGHGPFDFTRSGTETAPITYRAVGDVVLGNFIDIDDDAFQPVAGMASVHSIPLAAAPGRLFQTHYPDILVDDPNASIFTMTAAGGPLGFGWTEGAISEADLLAREGTARYDAATQTLRVHTFGDRAPSRTATDLVVASGTGPGVEADWNVFDGFRVTYSATPLVVVGSNNVLRNMAFEAVPMQLRGARNRAENIRVSHVITRGDTWEWHTKGGGSAAIVRGVDNQLQNIHVFHNWNSAVGTEGSTNVVIDGLRTHGAPNHCGTLHGGTDGHVNGTLRNFVSYNCQDSWLVSSSPDGIPLGKMTIEHMVSSGMLLRSMGEGAVVGPLIVRNSIFFGAIEFGTYMEPLRHDLCRYEPGSILENNVVASTFTIHHCADAVDYPIRTYIARCASGELTGCMTVRNNVILDPPIDWKSVFTDGPWGPALGDAWNVHLVPGSPAVDAGGASGAAADLRRLPRPDGSTTDIGIYEGL